MNRLFENEKIYNIFKGISIILVVAIHILYRFHSKNKPPLVEAVNYIIGFSVPLFMMIGGFFLAPKLINIKDKNALKQMFIRMLKRILLPYYIFVFILIIFRYSTGRSLDILPLFFLYDANTHGLYFIQLYIYAYCFSLFSLYISIFIFKINNKYLIYIYLPLMSLVFFPVSFQLLKIFPLNTVCSSLTYIVYFIVGFPIYFFLKKISEFEEDKKKCVLVTIFFSCVVYTGFLVLIMRNFENIHVFTTPPSIYRLILSIYFFIFLIITIDSINIVKIISEKTYVNKFGEQSLWIFFIHPYFIYPLPYIFHRFYEKILNTNYFIFPWFVSTYIITLISFLTYKTMPSFLKRLFSR